MSPLNAPKVYVRMSIRQEKQDCRLFLLPWIEQKQHKSSLLHIERGNSDSRYVVEERTEKGEDVELWFSFATSLTTLFLNWVVELLGFVRKYRKPLPLFNFFRAPGTEEHHLSRFSSGFISASSWIWEYCAFLECLPVRTTKLVTDPGLDSSCRL